MARILVAGGGLCGLTVGMLLAGDGHPVTVVERDPHGPPVDPEAAWDGWPRRGVPQFRQLYYLLPRFRQLVETELPCVADALASVALRHRPIADVCPVPGDADDELVALTARRPVVEAAVAAAAERTPGLTVRRGVGVRGLLTGAGVLPDTPHVVGVVTEAGEALSADLVIDATGRHSALGRWLGEIGARRPQEEREDSGFVYYSRHFRSVDGSLPATLGPLLQHFGSLSVLTLPADHGTWGVGLITSSNDVALRPLRDPDRWSAVAGALAPIAHWVQAEPITGVDVMARLEDCRRRLCPDGTPVVTGVVAVADACASTNPTLGRGTSLGLLHAIGLRDLVRVHGLDDPCAFALAFDEFTERELALAYRGVVVTDRHRLGEIDAAIRGEQYQTEDAAWHAYRALETLAGHDPDLLRGWFRIAGLLASGMEVFLTPGFLARFQAVLAEHPLDGPPVLSRARLLELVGGTATGPGATVRLPA